MLVYVPEEFGFGDDARRFTDIRPLRFGFSPFPHCVSSADGMGKPTPAPVPTPPMPTDNMDGECHPSAYSVVVPTRSRCLYFGHTAPFDGTTSGGTTP